MTLIGTSGTATAIDAGTPTDATPSVTLADGDGTLPDYICPVGGCGDDDNDAGSCSVDFRNTDCTTP